MLLQFTVLDAQSSVVSNAEALGMSSERLDKITSKWENYIDNKQLSGAVIYVARKGTPVYFEAIGQSDIAKKRSMEKDAIFRIASQSKAIVSLGVMMLQEDGLLRINDPLGKYIEEFNETTVAEVQEDGSYIVVPAKRKMTIRDLLTHTSGLGYGYGPAADQWKAADMQGWYFAHREEPILETVKRMASLPMDRHPGSTFWYGYSTDVLGALIEVVSGQSYEDYIQNHIMAPVGMNRSAAIYHNLKTKENIAEAHKVEKGEVIQIEAYDENRAIGAAFDCPAKAIHDLLERESRLDRREIPHKRGNLLAFHSRGGGGQRLPPACRAQLAVFAHIGPIKPLTT